MPSELALDHIGYAVADIEDYVEKFLVPLFGPESVSSVVEDPLQQVRIAFATLKGGERIELIQPVGESSPVNNVLNARRGGLYHLCFRVERIESEIERFREQGCLLVSGPTPAAAFQGRRIAFLLTPQADLIEFVETTPAK
jgi:methylmalonyl-CoA/ethylmalonyl-CoA epimerase